MIKGIEFINVTVDCKDAGPARDFYGKLLGWEGVELFGMPALKSPTGFTLLFVPEEADCPYEKPVWPEAPGKQQKQMHFDFSVDDLAAAEKQALALGATKAKDQYGGDHFVTFFDPAGHPFCLVAKG